jgi:hypothetical protein
VDLSRLPTSPPSPSRLKERPATYVEIHEYEKQLHQHVQQTTNPPFFLTSHPRTTYHAKR